MANTGRSVLGYFAVARDRSAVASEHVILERAIDLLQPGGRLGLVVPDGLLNNQGELSNCPRVRRFLALTGKIDAIVSLPDYAFRRSGAQNKTSILFFRKFTREEKATADRVYSATRRANGNDEELAVGAVLEAVNYPVFLAEANSVGYTTTGAPTTRNDLYRAADDGRLAADQSGTILGEYRRFRDAPDAYDGHNRPDCEVVLATELWTAHPSHRLDPKYYLFKREEQTTTPEGWVRVRIRNAMTRRENIVRPETVPDRMVVVMTIAQTGDIRRREAGKGHNPPQWLGMYFGDSSSTWFAARAGDVVFSSIDLWKGCISVVPDEFDGALVTKEFPIYEVTDPRLCADFLWCLLRSRYYQRAFRAITTGHSNRRRTQSADFEDLEIVFPADREVQGELIAGINRARTGMRDAGAALNEALMRFSDMIDGRIGEELPTVADVEETDEAVQT